LTGLYSKRSVKLLKLSEAFETREIKMLSPLNLHLIQIAAQSIGLGRLSMGKFIWGWTCNRVSVLLASKSGNVNEMINGLLFGKDEK